MRATTIEDVLRILAAIVADTRAKDGSAWLLSCAVPAGHAGGQDGNRARVFRRPNADVSLRCVVRERVFRGDEQFRADQQPSRAWQFAFDTARSQRVIILQNLLLSINAHINLDLGVVAGNAFAGNALENFHDDFNRINDILGSLIPAARDAVGQLSPLMEELSTIGGDDLVAPFWSSAWRRRVTMRGGRPHSSR